MGGIAEKFKTTLEAGGLGAAMRCLNDRVPYRYTAIFAFEGEMLRNVCLVDKENPDVTKCSDQPITQSYCMYVHRSRDRFMTEQASADQRVEGHPKRQSVQCYYGIPLFDSAGKMLGTVCHFDSSPVRITEAVAEALDDLAPLITEAAFGAKQALSQRTERLIA